MLANSFANSSGAIVGDKPASFGALPELANSKPDKIVNTVRRNQPEIVVGIESDGHAGWCFQPMAEGIRCVVVGKVVIPAMHARLIFYGPWRGKQLTQAPFDSFLMMLAGKFPIEIYDIDVFNRGRCWIIRQGVPNGGADEPSADRPVFEAKRPH